MSTQIANRIKIIPEHDVDTIMDGIITPKAGKSFSEYYTENNMVFEEKTKNDVYRQTLKPVIVMTKEEFTAIEHRQLIVLLYDTAGNTYVWGSLGNAVQFNSRTHTDRYTLEMHRISTSAIF